MVDIKDGWEKTKGKTFLRTEAQMNHPIRKMIVERGIGESVLDAGCATAIDYPLWKEKGFRYIGLDFTPKFLIEAERLYPRIELIEADMADIPLPDKSVAVAYFKDIWEHLPPGKYVDVCREVWRVTAKRMMVAFYIAPTLAPTKYTLVDNLHYKNHYNKDDIMNLFASLDDAQVVEVIENIGFNNSSLYVVDRVG